MRTLIWIVTVLAAIAITGDALAQSPGPFDGKWTTVVTCPAAEGAGSFTLLVDADVKAGVFSGEKGDKGRAWMVFAEWESPTGRRGGDFRQRDRPFFEIGGGKRSRRHGIRLSHYRPIGRLERNRRSAGGSSLQRDFHQTVISRQSESPCEHSAKGLFMSTRDHQRLIGDVRVMSTCPSTSDVLLSRSKRRSGPRSASRTAQISSRGPSVLDNHIHGTHLPSCEAVHSIVIAQNLRKMAKLIPVQKLKPA